MQIPYTLNKEIVDFLTALPNIREHQTQHALILAAGFDPPLLNQINLSGSPGQFFQLLIPLLSSYGTLEDGRDAVDALLEAASQKVGRDQRIRATNLRNHVRKLRGQAPLAAPDPDQETTAPAPNDQAERPATSPNPLRAELPKVVIEVGPATVSVRYAGHTYSGPNLLQSAELLKAATPREYGELLFRGILHDVGSQAGSGDFTTIYGYRRAIEDSEQRIVTEIALDPNDLSLYEYKWEYLKNPSNPTPLFLSERSPVYRRLQGAVSRRIQVAAHPLKILVAIANPAALGQPGNKYLQQLAPIDVNQERAILETALSDLQKTGKVEYTVLKQPITPAALLDALQDGAHILHLIAHGLFLPQPLTEKIEYYLVMDRDDGKPPFVAMDEFQTIVHAGTQLALVILAACQSAGKDTVDALRGLGPTLVQQGLPAVIAMQNQISMKAAQQFARYFYDDLARSGRVDQALAATRLALYNPRKPEDWEWGFPVLLMSVEDGRMFDVGSKA